LSDWTVGTGRPAGPPVLRPPRRIDAAGDAPPGPGNDGAGATPAVDEAVVDPRMVARRIAVRRDEGRRRLRRLLTGVAVTAAIALAALLTRTPLLNVDHIRVQGADTSLRADVVEAVTGAGAGLGTPMLDVDLAAVAAAVEAVPTVATADVDRAWPGTLTVQVRPRVPVATIGGALVAEDGVVVAVGVPPGATTLAGIEGVEVPTAAGAQVDAPELLAVAATLPEEVRAAVAGVRAGSADGEVELRLSGGGVARLGPTTGLGAKLVAVATVLEQVDLTCLATIDVRVPSAPTVTRAPGCGA
jgi:cell division protein FtsQ